jgi:hypothetical protein
MEERRTDPEAGEVNLGTPGTRRQRHTSLRHGLSVGNLSDDFRRIWLVNLYSKRVNVGTGPVFSSVAPGEAPPPDETPCGEGTSQPICPS